MVFVFVWLISFSLYSISMFFQMARFCSFLLLSNISSCVCVCVCVYPILFIHLLTNGHLGCFPIFSLRNEELGIEGRGCFLFFLQFSFIFTCWTQWLRLQIREMRLSPSKVENRSYMGDSVFFVGLLFKYLKSFCIVFWNFWESQNCAPRSSRLKFTLITFPSGITKSQLPNLTLKTM